MNRWITFASFALLAAPTLAQRGDGAPAPRRAVVREAPAAAPTQGDLLAEVRRLRQRVEELERAARPAPRGAAETPRGRGEAGPGRRGMRGVELRERLRRHFDTNADGALDTAERDAARDEVRRRIRDRVDTNDDGQLDSREREVVRQRLQQRFGARGGVQGGERLGRGNGGPGSRPHGGRGFGR